MITGVIWVVCLESLLGQEAATDPQNRLEGQGLFFAALLHRFLRICPLRLTTTVIPHLALRLENHLQMTTKNDNTCMGGHLEAVTPPIDLQIRKGIPKSSVGGLGINHHLTITMIATGGAQTGLGAHQGHPDETGALEDLPQGVTAGHQKGNIRVLWPSGLNKAKTGMMAIMMIMMMSILLGAMAPEVALVEGSNAL